MWLWGIYCYIYAYWWTWNKLSLDDDYQGEASFKEADEMFKNKETADSYQTALSSSSKIIKDCKC